MNVQLLSIRCVLVSDAFVTLGKRVRDQDAFSGAIRVEDEQLVRLDLTETI